MKLQLKRKTEEDSAARDKCSSSCALSEEKAVPGIKASRFVSTTSMLHKTNTWEKKWQWGKGMLLLKQQGLVQTAHQELHNPCSGMRKWLKILEEIVLLSLKTKIKPIPERVCKRCWHIQSSADASPWHPGRNTWLHSTTCQCVCMNIKASVGQWLIVGLFLLKLILIPPVSHFHPPPNEHPFSLLQLWTPTALLTTPGTTEKTHAAFLECVC